MRRSQQENKPFQKEIWILLFKRLWLTFSSYSCILIPTHLSPFFFFFFFLGKNKTKFCHILWSSIHCLIFLLLRARSTFVNVPLSILDQHLECTYFRCEYSARVWHIVPVTYLVSIFVLLEMCGFFLPAEIFAEDTSSLKISIIVDPFSALANGSSTPSEKHNLIQNNTLNHWCDFEGRHQQHKMIALRFSFHEKSAQCFAVPCMFCYMAYTCAGSISGKSTKACRCWEKCLKKLKK